MSANSFVINVFMLGKGLWELPRKAIKESVCRIETCGPSLFSFVTVI